MPVVFICVRGACTIGMIPTILSCTCEEYIQCKAVDLSSLLEPRLNPRDLCARKKQILPFQNAVIPAYHHLGGKDHHYTPQRSEHFVTQDSVNENCEATSRIKNKGNATTPKRWKCRQYLARHRDPDSFVGAQQCIINHTVTSHLPYRIDAEAVV